MELTRGQSIEQRRKALDETRSRDAAKCFVFREAELVDAVRVEARAGTRAVDSAGFDFSEMGEELSEELIGAAHEAACAREELGVREVLE
jgi:hypothetical protein